MSVLSAVFYLALFLGSGYGQGQKAVSFEELYIKPSSPASNSEKQVEENSGIIVQSAIDFPDWPLKNKFILNTKIADENETQVYLHPMEQQTSNSKPVEHVPDMFDAFKPQYTLLDGLGYYRMVKGKKFGWEQARAACKAEGAHLAVVNSRREAQALHSFYYTNGIKTDLIRHTMWVGAYRPRGHHQYITVHGTPLKKVGFNAWSDDREDKNTEERCVILDVEEEKLRSTTCQRDEHHICEHAL